MSAMSEHRTSDPNAQEGTETDVEPQKEAGLAMETGPSSEVSANGKPSQTEAHDMQSTGKLPESSEKNDMDPLDGNTNVGEHTHDAENRRGNPPADGDINSNNTNGPADSEDIGLDLNVSEIDNITRLSNYYHVPEVLIKSLFDLNNKRRNPPSTGTRSNNLGGFGGHGAHGGEGGSSDVCNFILKLETEIITFITNSKMASWKMRPLNSYYRLLSHQLAEYYQLGHIISNSDFSMVLFKINTSLINADDETKKHATFDESGNIKPLNFRNLTFDPKEKLNRIKLSELYRKYKPFFDELKRLNQPIGPIIGELHALQLGSSTQSMNSNIKIMQRGNVSPQLSEGRSREKQAELRRTSGASLSGTESGSLLSKEEQYKLAKERISKEQENGMGDGVDNDNDYENEGEGEGEGEDEDEDDDAETQIIVGTSSPSASEGSQNGGYTHDIDHEYRTVNGNDNYDRSQRTHERNGYNGGYRRNYKPNNGPNSKYRSYNNNRQGRNGYRYQYGYYPSNQMYPMGGAQNYMMAPTTAAATIPVVPAPLGSPNPVPTGYFYVPVMQPTDGADVEGKGETTALNTNKAASSPPYFPTPVIPISSSVPFPGHIRNQQSSPSGSNGASQQQQQQRYPYYYPTSVGGADTNAAAPVGTVPFYPVSSTSPNNGMYMSMMYYSGVNGGDGSGSGNYTRGRGRKRNSFKGNGGDGGDAVANYTNGFNDSSNTYTYAYNNYGDFNGQYNGGPKNYGRRTSKPYSGGSFDKEMVPLQYTDDEKSPDVPDPAIDDEKSK